MLKLSAMPKVDGLAGRAAGSLIPDSMTRRYGGLGITSLIALL